MTKLTLASVEQDEGTVVHEYKCNFVVKLAGDSIWGCMLKTVNVTGINIIHRASDEDCIYTEVYVKHDGGEGSWTMYTDSGFSDAISKALGFAVDFTEQGMQEDNLASMEC